MKVFFILLCMSISSFALYFDAVDTVREGFPLEGQRSKTKNNTASKSRKIEPSQQAKVFKLNFNDSTVGGYSTFTTVQSGKPDLLSLKCDLRLSFNSQGDYYNLHYVNEKGRTKSWRSGRDGTIIAYCDGDNVYYLYFGYFTKLHYYGEKAWFWGAKQFNTTGAGGFGSMTTIDEDLFILNMYTGDVKKINKSSIEKMLLKNPKLLTIYENDKNPRKKRSLYLDALLDGRNTLTNYNKTTAHKQSVNITSSTLSTGKLLVDRNTTIVLSSGKSYYGKLIKETENNYYLDIKGSEITFYKKVVKEIFQESLENGHSY